MTDEQKKELTEYLGECWVIPYKFWDYGYGIMREINNRTFATDADFLALCRKAVEKKEFRAFMQHFDMHLNGGESNVDLYTVREVEWLFLENPERSCKLFAEWLGGRG